MPKNKKETDSSSGSDSDSDHRAPSKKGKSDNNKAPEKAKKQETESSDSDSGPEDRAPAPAQKKAPTGNSKAAQEKSNKKQWTLEKLRQVNINEFRGRKMVDIREFYEKNGEILPGKKGISLSLSQWKTLMSYADEITAAAED